MHKNNGQGLLKVKIGLSLRKLYAYDMITHYHLPSQEFMIWSPCEVPFRN